MINMRRIIKKSCLVICLFMIVFILVGCSIESNKDYIAKQIKIDIPDVLTIEHMDDHGGFHGDGERFAKIEFDGNNASIVLSQIEKSKKWNEMPLTENLNLIMYGGVKDNVGYTYSFAAELGIPEIINGYWLFIDRHTQSRHPEKDTELFDRYSFNFTLAMYDLDTNTLYYYELDT